MADRDDKRPPHLEEDELPPTEEEIAASARLRDALESGAPTGDAETDEAVLLARSLRAAWQPAPLEREEHDEVVADVEETEVERRDAERLRDALAGGPATTPTAELARALANAWSPRSLPEDEHRALVDAALAAVPRGPGRVLTFRRTAIVRAGFGAVAAGLALAASVFVVVRVAPQDDEVPLARARSTQPLFDEPFRAGETSARIDRIALARASDFRNNRFAKWGVR